MKTLQDAYDLAIDLDSKAEDFFSPFPGIWFDEHDLLCAKSYPFDVGARPRAVTDHAFGQLFQRTTGSSDGRKLLLRMRSERPNDIGLANTMNAFMHDCRYTTDKRNGKPKSVLIRGYESQARAFFSPYYTIFDNSNIINATLNYLNKSGYGGRLSYTSHLDKDGMVLKIALEGVEMPTSDGEYGLGFMLKASSIGRSSIYVLPMVKRTACDNSLIVQYDDKEMKLFNVPSRIRHTGGQHELTYLVTKSLAWAIERSTEIPQFMIDAAMKEIPNAASVISGIMDKVNKAARKQALLTAFQGAEGSNTVAGIVNAVTFAAHAAPDLSPDERVELETWGGTVLRNTHEMTDSNQIVNEFFRVAGKQLVTEEEVVI